MLVVCKITKKIKIKNYYFLKDKNKNIVKLSMDNMNTMYL